VIIRPRPSVKIAIKKEITSIIIPPGMVEYNIPKGPKRTVKIIERPIFLVGIEMTCCGCIFK